MNLSNLKYLGLTPGEVKVYSTLLKNGGQSVQGIITLSGLKKGDCYNKLYDLKDKGLIQEYKEKKAKHFRLTDPQKLEELANDQYQTALQAKKEVESTLPILMSSYNLNYHKPGVNMFEGKDALVRILEDTLLTKSDILQFVDSQAFDQYLPQEDAKYVSNRLKLKVKKRMIIPNTTSNRNYAKTRSKDYLDCTEIRFIGGKMASFKTSMYIYDDKISYQTLKPKSMIGVIIEDKLISLMHREIFEFMWSKSLSVEEILKGKN